MISLGSGLINQTMTWTALKTMISSKILKIQYEDDTVNNWYFIFAIDSIVVYTTVIFKGTVPTVSDVDQSTNDSYKTDFETNFKPFANRPLNPQSAITLGYTTSSGSVLTVIRATAYTEQTTNAQRSLVSSNVNDTSAGTGARTVKITYYDQTLLGPFTETVSMSGTTPVNTVATNICFIEKIEVTTVGNQLSNIGTITLKAATAGGGATIGTIPAGDGITNWCHHYVGINKTMQIISAVTSVKGTASGTLELHRTIPTDITRPELTIAPKLRTDAGDTDKLNFDVPIIVQGPALVLAYGRSDSASGTLDWSVGIGYYEA